jgi:hypothetical protein
MPTVPIRLSQRSDMHMVDKCDVASVLDSKDGPLLQVDNSSLMLEMPDVEEIAKSIWQRQRDALGPNSIHYDTKWCDQSVPRKFWDEFVLDAQAVLTLLCEKHYEYQKAR